MILLLLLFMYVFGFKLFYIEQFNSTILVGVILVIFFIFSTNYRDVVLYTLKRKRVLQIFIYLIYIILFCFFLSTVQLTYEYSIGWTFINQFINLFIGLLVYCLFITKRVQDKLVSYLIYVFLLQAGIQLISFLSPSIYEILNIFRYDKAIAIGQEQYSGIRGLSISGQSFFGLGVGYGFIYILFFMYWKKIFTKNTIIKIIALCLLIFGGTSAARSSYLGLLIAFIYVILKWIFVYKKFSVKSFSRKKILRILLTLSLLTILIVTVIIPISNRTIDQKFDKMNEFAFQFIHNYQESGQLNTSSTNALFNNMYFKIDDSKTILIGDAIFTNDDGSYYMHTDAGYMRNILYFGIVGFLILLIYQTRFFNWRNPNIWMSNILIFIYILIMHVKGDVLGFSIMLQNLLFLFYLREIGFKNIIEKDHSIESLNRLK